MEFWQNKDGTVVISEVDEEDIQVIGHPVMIGDVLDYIDKKFYKPGQDQEELRMQRRLINMVWRDKRKPIDEQKYEVIEYVYNLIK